MGKKGRLISFEGVDGGGKTDQIKAFADYFKNRNRPYLVVKDMGTTDLGEKLSEIIKNRSIDKTPRAELFLFLAARSNVCEKVIIPALNEGLVVICDRFVYSSVAYQGVARGLGKGKVIDLNNYATDWLKPDLTIILDVDPVIGLQRSKRRERLEVDNDLDFYKRVRRAYLSVKNDHDRVAVINTDNPNWDEIHQEIVKKFEELEKSSF